MKRVFAFIVLLVEFAILAVVVSLVFTFLLWCFAQISVLSLAFRAIIYIALGSTILGIALAPLIYGAGIMVATSEAIAESEQGIRYIIFATAAFVLCAVIVLLYWLMTRSVSIVYIYLAIVAIVVGATGRAQSKDNL